MFNKNYRIFYSLKLTNNIFESQPKYNGYFKLIDALFNRTNEYVYR